MVQETCLRAWKSLDSLQDEKAAKSWLITILRRENARRFERKQFDLVDIDDYGNDAKVSDDPHHQQEWLQARLWIAYMIFDSYWNLSVSFSMRNHFGHLSIVENISRSMCPQF